MIRLRHRAPAGRGAPPLMGVCVAACLALGAGLAWADTGSLDTNVEYNVTYQVSFNQARELGFVKIDDIVKISGRTFLVVYQSGFKNRTYIDFDSVRSMVPAVR